MSGVETTTLPSATLEDLDLDRVARFLRHHFPSLLPPHPSSLEPALLALRLAGPMGTRSVPTHAGIYLFGTLPQLLMPGWGLQLANFQGTSLTTPLLSTCEATGPLDVLFASAWDWIERQSKVLPALFGDPQPELEFDAESVKEALANALIHRDLRATGTVAVHLFCDRLSIWSPGPCALSQPLSSYAQRPEGAPSMPRNPLVARLAQAMGLCQRLGRGVAMMGRADQRRPVTLEDSREGVLVTIPSARHGQDGSLRE